MFTIKKYKISSILGGLFGLLVYFSLWSIPVCVQANQVIVKITDDSGMEQGAYFAIIARRFQSTLHRQQPLGDKKVAFKQELIPGTKNQYRDVVDPEIIEIGYNPVSWITGDCSKEVGECGYFIAFFERSGGFFQKPTFKTSLVRELKPSYNFSNRTGFN